MGHCILFKIFQYSGFVFIFLFVLHFVCFLNCSAFSSFEDSELRTANRGQRIEAVEENADDNDEDVGDDGDTSMRAGEYA